MKTLIVEDDLTSRLLLQQLIRPYSEMDVACNGKEAIEAVRSAMSSGQPYDVICLDIMMPQMDGQAALTEIRKIEEDNGILSSEGAKIIMTTALGDMKNVKNAFQGLCDAYLVKPIDKHKLVEHLHAFGLIS